MKKLVVKPIGGMCNRLYCLASAVALAKLQNRELIVLWDLKWEFNARLGDIIVDKQYNIIYKDEYNFPRRHFDKLFVSFEKYKRNALLFTNERMYAVSREIGTTNFQSFFGQFAESEIIYIESCFNFIPNRNFKLTEIFQPTAEILGEMNGELKKLGNNFIGMHIRRTEHQYALDYSPDEVFINNLLTESKSDNVLLVTDDQKTEDKFVEQFGSRLYIYSKDKRRDTLKSVKSAMVNIMLLSKSRIIYGSFNSTFSTFPAEYGETPIKILATEQAHL
jgi:hypothetical protein